MNDYSLMDVKETQLRFYIIVNQMAKTKSLHLTIPNPYLEVYILYSLTTYGYNAVLQLLKYNQKKGIAVQKSNSLDAVSDLGVATEGSALTLVFHSISRKYRISAAPFFLQAYST